MCRYRITHPGDTYLPSIYLVRLTHNLFRLWVTPTLIFLIYVSTITRKRLYKMPMTEFEPRLQTTNLPTEPQAQAHAQLSRVRYLDTSKSELLAVD